MFTGAGSQTDTNGRWGDYSMTTIDPADNMTFWTVGEYYANTRTPFNWHHASANSILSEAVHNANALITNSNSHELQLVRRSGPSKCRNPFCWCVFPS